MLEGLFLNKVKRELKIKTLEEYEVIAKKLDKEELDRVRNILSKDVLFIDDINDLLIDYFSYEFNEEMLVDLISDNVIIDKYVLYSIYSYLLNNGSNKIIELVVRKFGYSYTVSDIKIIDKYLKSSKFNDNELALSLLEKIYVFEQTKGNSLFKEKINDLIMFKLDVDNKVFPYELVNNFVKVRNIKNKYYLLNKIEDTMFNKTKYKKNMLLIYFTYNYRISDKLDKYFKNVILDKEDVILFIKCLEDNNIVLNDKQLNNLLNGFKKKYYSFNLRQEQVSELCNKVIVEYNKYYDANYYFRIEEFIKYYNDKYDDDFSSFIYTNNSTILNTNILFSIFEGNNLLGNYFVFGSFNEGFLCFKNIELVRKRYLLDEEKFYKEKKKFYRKYKSKINEFLINRDNYCIKYFMLRNINAKDRGKFYELFKILYKDNYKSLGKGKGTVRKSIDKLKVEFVVELLSSSYSDRYEIIDKYVNYVNYIDGKNYINENFFKLVMLECEKSLEMAQELVKQLREYLYDDGVLNKNYRILEKKVKKEFSGKTIDYLFGNIWNEYKYLEEEYMKIKSRIQKDAKKKVKRKSVK